MKALIYILLLTVFFFSCKKEPLPENTFGNATFFLNGKINGFDKAFVAGDDGFYMYTHTENVFGLDIIEGSLSDENESIKIQFFKSPVSNSAINIGAYNHLNFNNLIKQVYVDSISEGAISGFEWNINGTSYNQINIDSLINTPGKYEICLTINYLNNCSQSLCSDYMIGMSDTYSLDFIYKLFPDSTMQCVPQIASTNEVEHIEWRVNDNTSSNSGVLEQTISPGIHKVEMVVTFKDGMVLKKAKNIRHMNQDCYFEEIRIEGNPDFEVREGAIISYTDESGETFVSYYQDQPDDFKLSVLEKNEYKPNNEGQKVLQLKIQFNAVLKSVDHPENTRILNDFIGKFGVAIP